jgi:uncharacterized protein (TIGR02001 family)
MTCVAIHLNWTKLGRNFLRDVLWFCSLTTAPAYAEWHGDIKFLSEYSYRGYSKSRGNPVVQGHIDYQDQMGWFGGLGVSQVSFDDQNTDPSHVEIKPYLGWSLPMSDDWRGELFVNGYIYDADVFAQRADYAEIYAVVHFQDWLSGKVSLAPDAYQRQNNIFNYELNYRQDILDNLQFSGGLGFYQADKLVGEDYFYWNLGVSWFVTSYLAIDARYVDLHLDQQHDDGDHHGEFYPRPIENNYQISVTVGF